MKKQILLYLLPVLALFSACQDTEVDNLFDESPEARTNAAITKVKSDLIGSEYGWLSEYYYNDSTMHTTLLFHFKEGNRVVIESVFEDYLSKESNYTMKYAQQLDVTFDTYNVLGYLMDETHFADFRWELESEIEDGYKFISRADKSEGISYLTLKRADETTAEYMAAQRVIHSVRMKLAHNPEKSYFRNLRTTTLPYGYKFTFNKYNDEVSFFGPFNGSLGTFTTKAIISGDGKVKLEQPLDLGGVFIRELSYNDQFDAFVISDSDGIEGAIIYDTAPAFTLNGLTDYFLSWSYSNVMKYSSKAQVMINGVKEALPSFVVTQFYPNWGVLLIADPAPDGKNRWDGQISIKYTKLAENLVSLDNTEATYFRTWFEPIYNNNASLKSLYDEFFCNPEGLYIDYIESGVIYLVSKADPTLYIQVNMGT